MAEGARVQDPDTIRMFRASVIKFIESSNAALADAEGEITRRQAWLESEQTVYWQGQIRKLQELIGHLKEAIRMKKLFKDSSGRTPSAFDEEKKLRAAQLKLQNAEEKLVNTRRWAKQLQREHLMYRGGVQRLQTMLTSDLVVSVATLDRVLTQLTEYLEIGAPTLATSEAGSTESAGEMRRSADGDVPAGATSMSPASADPPPPAPSPTPAEPTPPGDIYVAPTKSAPEPEHT